MPRAFSHSLMTQSLMLLHLDQISTVFGRENTISRTRLRGELALGVDNRREAGADLEFLRLDLFGESGGAVDVGEISVVGDQGTVTFRESDRDSVSFFIEFSSEWLYESIISAVGYPIRRDDLLLSPREAGSGTLSGVLELLPGDRGWRMRGGTLEIQLQPASEIIGVVRRISLDLRDTRASFAGGARDSCPRGQEGVKRSISIRPVMFELGGVMSGGPYGVQFRKMVMLWGGCCIDFKPLPQKVIKESQISPALRDALRTGDLDKIAAAYSEPGVIEIFFVTHDLKTYGGGATLNGGLSQAKVIITDQSTGNPQLLAHEIGHVFRGDHPTSTDPYFWPADRETVLKPGTPNPERNTVKNCRKARNPALLAAKSPEACCLEPIGR